METPIDPYQAEIEALCRAHRVRSLFLVGSAADGTFDRSRSDVDFLVEFDPAETSASAYFALRDGLSVLLGRDVDLIERHAVVNPYLKASLEREKVSIYGAA